MQLERLGLGVETLLLPRESLGRAGEEQGSAAGSWEGRKAKRALAAWGRRQQSKCAHT